MGEVQQALIAFVFVRQGAGEGIDRLGDPAELADQQGPLDSLQHRHDPAHVGHRALIPMQGDLAVQPATQRQDGGIGQPLIIDPVDAGGLLAHPENRRSHRRRLDGCAPPLPQQAGLAQHQLETDQGGWVQPGSDLDRRIPQHPQAAAITSRDLPVVVVHTADHGAMGPQQSLHIGEPEAAPQRSRRNGSVQWAFIHARSPGLPVIPGS